jgi:hypothetical protein
MLTQDVRGCLAVVPEEITAPPVEIFRRGIAVTRTEIVPAPLNSCVCGIVDINEINVKPDRETLVQDIHYRRLAETVAEHSQDLLIESAARAPDALRRVIQAHRKVVTVCMLTNDSLRRKIGAHYTVPLYRSIGDEREIELQELAARQRKLVWVEDAVGERALADRAFHLGRQPVVVEHQPEQDLVSQICHDLGLPCQRAADAYFDEMRTQITAAPRSEQLFRRVIPEDFELLCCDDNDERLPVRVLRLAGRTLSLPPGADRADLLLHMLLQRFAEGRTDRTIVLINRRNRVIERIESGRQPFRPEDLSLARLLFFLGRMSCGVTVTAEETMQVYDDLLNWLESREGSRRSANNSWSPLDMLRRLFRGSSK